MPAPTLRAIRGAPITCLMALWVIGKPATKEQIADETGYQSGAVHVALRVLQRFNLALALPDGRHPRWALTANSPQLPLGWLVEQVSRDNRESTPPTTTRSIGGDLSTGQVEEAEVSRDNRESLEALAQAGIGEPTRSRLAALPHVTPAYVRAHVARLRRERRTDQTGLLVHRIQQADLAPLDPDDNSRYTTGQFAEYLET